MSEFRYFYSHTRNSFLLLIETILALVVLAVAGLIGAFFLSGGYAFVVENFDISRLIPVQNTKILLAISVGIALLGLLYLAFVVSDFVNKTALVSHRATLKVGKKLINNVLSYRTLRYRPQYYIYEGDLVTRYHVGRAEFFAADVGDKMTLTLPLFSRQPVEVELLKSQEVQAISKVDMRAVEKAAPKRLWIQKIKQVHIEETVTDYEVPD